MPPAAPARVLGQDAPEHPAHERVHGQRDQRVDQHRDEDLLHEQEADRRVDATVSLLLLQQILIAVLVNTLLALPVHALVRRIIRPVLPEDPRRRRRRAYTTGGLSPLQQGAARRGPISRPQTR